MNCQNHKFTSATRMTRIGLGLCEDCAWTILQCGYELLTLDGEQSICLNQDGEPVFTDAEKEKP